MKFKPEASEKEQIKEKLKEIKLKAAEDKEIARTYIYKNKERNKMKIELGIKRHAKGPNPLSCKKKIKIYLLSSLNSTNNLQANLNDIHKESCYRVILISKEVHDIIIFDSFSRITQK